VAHPDYHVLWLYKSQRKRRIEKSKNQGEKGS